MARYLVPDIPPGSLFRLEETVKRSRFLVSMAHAPHPDAAREMVERIKAEFPDATHNCWAFAAGAPGETARVGYSDDGEPHGTAGRPMLTVLLHGGVGEVCAVVTRYFGGIKLGTGGLVRAYQGMVRLGLDELPTRLFMPPARLEVVLEYSRITPFQRMLPEFEATIESESFAADAAFVIVLPETNLQAFSSRLTDMTEGTVLIQQLAEQDPPEGRG